MSKKSYHVGQASAETAPPGLIQQSEKLNALLAEAYEITARIIGLSPTARDAAEPNPNLVSRLENELGNALDSLQLLIEQLREIADKF